MQAGNQLETFSQT